jgi:hypothetical protein
MRIIIEMIICFVVGMITAITLTHCGVPLLYTLGICFMEGMLIGFLWPESN